MQAFDEQPHLQLLKEMLMHIFSTPKRHAKSKPFHDHVISFSVADDRLWLRNYQVRLFRSICECSSTACPRAQIGASMLAVLSALFCPRHWTGICISCIHQWSVYTWQGLLRPPKS